jgi:hypothetical protein
MKKDTPDKGYSLLEIHLFLVLKEIYKQFFNGKLTKNAGETLKRLAVAEYETKLKKYQLEQEIYKNMLECIRKTEPLRCKFRHELNNKDANALNTAIELIELYSLEIGTWKGVNDIE